MHYPDKIFQIGPIGLTVMAFTGFTYKNTNRQTSKLFI